jgi:hypothetical protein
MTADVAAAVPTGMLSAGRLMTAEVAAAVPTGMLSAGRLMTAVELAAASAEAGTDGVLYGLLIMVS